MATTITKYFTDELAGWKKTIAFYRQEMQGLTVKLSEVIQRNSIPGIAAKVEKQQDKLNAVIKKFARLQTQFRQQEKALKTDSTFIDDSLVEAETENGQKGLREVMLQAEREYIDAKYGCHNFLSEVFRKRID
jgi:hypothetical protein